MYNSIVTYTVFYAYFDAPTSNSQTVFRTQTNVVRHFIFSNNGNGIFNADPLSQYQHFFNFQYDLGGVTNMEITHVDLIIGTSSFPNLIPATSTNFTVVINPVTYPNEDVQPSESIEVIIHMDVTDCIAQQVTGQMSHSWGCHISNETCRTPPNVVDSYSRNQTVDIFISRTYPGAPNPPGSCTAPFWDNSCIGQPVDWQLSVTNNSGHPFFNCFLNLNSPISGAVQGLPFMYTYILESSISTLDPNLNAINTADYLIESLQNYYTGDWPHCLIDHDANTETPIFRAVFPDPTPWGPIDPLHPEDWEGGFQLNDQETYSISFQTIRCCPELDNENWGFNAFGNDLSFNHWRFYLRGEDDCGNMVLSQTDDLQCQFALSSEINLSTNLRGNSGTDLKLHQEYEPTFTDITAPNNGCGGLNEIVIHNTLFDDNDVVPTNLEFDQQLYQNTPTAAPSGEIRIRFDLGPGLRLLQSASPNGSIVYAYMRDPQTGIQWNYNLSGVTPDPATNWNTNSQNNYEAIFEFDGSNFATFADFKQFMNHAETHIFITGCCPAAGPNVGHFDIKTYINPLPRTNCNDCFIPLSRVEDDISIHCPGCITPGIESISYSLTRTAPFWGLPDDVPNGVDDGIVNTTAQPINANTPGVRFNHSIPGDRLESRLVGIFHDGEVFPVNLSLAEWNDEWDASNPLCQSNPNPDYCELNTLYIEQRIPGSETAQFNLQPDGCTLTINGGPPITITTQLAVHPTSPINCPDEYFYKISLTDIQNVYPGYYWTDGDEFVLTTFFNVCNNPVVVDQFGVQRFEADLNRNDPFIVRNAMYISNDERVCGEVFYNNTPWAGEQPNASNGVEFLLPDYIYCCGAFSAPHRFYAIPSKVEGVWINRADVDFCVKGLQVNEIIKIGGNAVNVFPHEVRTPVPAPYSTTMTVNVPPGYEISDYIFGSKIPLYGMGCNPVCYHSIEGDVPAAAITGLWTFTDLLNMPVADNTMGINPSVPIEPLIGGTAVVGDEDVEFYLHLHLRPLCPNVATTEHYVANDVTATTPFFGGCPPNPGINTRVNEDRYAIGDLTFSTDDLLALGTPLPTGVLNNNQVCWSPLSLFNDAQNNFAAGATNAWVFIPSTLGLTNITLVCITPNCPAVQPISHDIPGVGTWFDLGFLGPNTNAYEYTLCADVCLADGIPHQIPISHGWNCMEPDWTAPPIPNGYCGSYPTENLELLQPEVALGTTKGSPPTEYTICEESSFEACVTSSGAGVGDFFANFNIPAGLTFNPANVSATFYPGNVPIPITGVDIIANPPGQMCNGTASNWQVNLQNYDYIFGPDALLSGGESICIYYRLEPSCEYDPAVDGMQEVCFNGINYCGDAQSVLPVEYAVWFDSGLPHPQCPCLEVEITANVSQTTICSDEITLTATVTGASGTINYVWSDGNGGIYPNAAVITFTPTPPYTTYTFTVVVTDDNGSVTSTPLTFNVINSSGTECCIPAGFVPNPISGFYDFSNYSVTDVISMYGTTPFFSGNTVSGAPLILINGTFTIDDDFTILGCSDVQLGPGAQIIYQGIHTLSIQSSTLHACGPMWQEISVPNGATLFAGDSHFEDAQQAVYSTGTPFITLTGNTFNVNRIGVHLANGDFVNVSITANEFNCNNFLTLPYVNNEFTASHILLEEADNVTIGTAGAANLNEFYNANIGIESYDANLTIDNNIFDESTNPQARYAISALGTPAFVTSYYINIGSGSPNQINNYSIGVFVNKNYNTTIYGNNFDMNRTCIEVINANTRNINIEENVLDRFTNSGITLQDNHYADVIVFKNYLNDGLTNFNNSPEARRGIFVNNTTVSLPSMLIKENRIYNCRFGIQVRNQDNCYITANIIHYLLSDAEILNDLNVYRNGIIVQECYSHNYGFEISYNEIYHDCIGCNTDPLLQSHLRGISIERSWAAVHDNYGTLLPTMARVYDNCNGTEFHCNVWDRGQQGFVWDDNSQLLDQGNPNDATNNEWRNWIGTWRIEKTPASLLTLVPWYYNSSGGIDFEVDPFFQILPDVIVPHIAQPNNENCTGIYNGGGGGGHQALMVQIINDSDYVSNLFENKYHDRAIIYQQLKDSIELMYSGTSYDADLQNFFSLMALSNAGLLSNVNEHLANGDIAAAVIANNEINPANVIEANSKFVNTICLQEAGDTITYDSLQRINLLAIAYQLPAIGGSAVYRARAILKIDVDDTQLEYRMQGRPASFNLPEYLLFPNPNDGSFSINYSINENESAWVNVFDGIGKIIVERNLSSSEHAIEFDLSNHGNGIYFVQLVSSRAIEKYWKVVVVK